MRIQYLCIKVEAGGEMCFTRRSYKKQFLIHLQPRGNCLKGFRAKKKFASVETKKGLIGAMIDLRDIYSEFQNVSDMADISV